MNKFFSDGSASIFQFGFLHLETVFWELINSFKKGPRKILISLPS